MVLVGLFAAVSILRAARRRSRGPERPAAQHHHPHDRRDRRGGRRCWSSSATSTGAIWRRCAGVPWVVPFVLAVIVLWSFLLGKTRTGRYIYAIGANPEAARRAGINVAWIRDARLHPVAA